MVTNLNSRDIYYYQAGIKHAKLGAMVGPPKVESGEKSRPLKLLSGIVDFIVLM